MFKNPSIWESTCVKADIVAENHNKTSMVSTFNIWPLPCPLTKNVNFYAWEYRSKSIQKSLAIRMFGSHQTIIWSEIHPEDCWTSVSITVLAVNRVHISDIAEWPHLYTLCLFYHPLHSPHSTWSCTCDWIDLTWVDGLYFTQAQLLDVDLREDGSNSRYFKMQNIYCHSYLLTSFCTQVYGSAKSFMQSP